MRRQPVYLILDVSGSMSGEPIEAVRNGVQLLVGNLRSDPYSLETAHISVITFNGTARQVVPLTELVSFQPPELQPSDLQAGSASSLGEALKVTKVCIEREVQASTPEVKGDWKPWVFIMTSGRPTDDWQRGLQEFKKVKTQRVIACAASPQADTNLLRQITDTVVSLDDADNSAFSAVLNHLYDHLEASISTTKGE